MGMTARCDVAGAKHGGADDGMTVVLALGVGHHVRWPRAQDRRGTKLRYILCTYNMATEQLVYVIAI